MKRIADLIVMAILLILCLTPRVLQASWLGVFVGPFSPNFEEINELAETLNEEWGTNLRFEGGGLMYSFVPKSRASALNRSKAVDVSFWRTTTSDAISEPWVDNQKTERDIKAELIVIPVFLGRIYHTPGIEGSLCPYLGIGLGTVASSTTFSQKVRTYFIDPDGNVQEVEESWAKSFLIATLAGQLLAGVEYKLSYTRSIWLEARYIASSEAEIRDPEATIGDRPHPIEVSIDWSGFSYRLGLMIWF